MATGIAELSDLITAKELAAALRVTEHTVYRWARARRIPSLQLGRVLRFRLADALRAITGGDAADGHDGSPSSGAGASV